LRFCGGNGVDNGFQSGKGDTFEDFLALYHVRCKSRISVSLSDEVIEEVERRRVWSSVPLTMIVCLIVCSF